MSEQRQYEAELSTRVVSPLEIQAELRKKALQLKINKENERIQFVKEKYDQKWRYLFNSYKISIK